MIDEIEITEACARGYCDECNEHKTIDPDLVSSIVKEVMEAIKKDAH